MVKKSLPLGITETKCHRVNDIRKGLRQRFFTVDEVETFLSSYYIRLPFQEGQAFPFPSLRFCVVFGIEFFS
ncbi:hypothetical protein CEXT_246051 [Caerostris extrusa]|uniref:Uncharacterized protein n=1 Tax=Caerostris extrusa TaxID=172846 RepID=A0AAV4WPK6_CAEEX|nr:hypothetical protein CEXT_246051 [Caerostris extrusa]